ncbi:MAG: beta-lactamase family protein [Clostridiales bacterium]|nr:beta-lactamase family protein [Clostridiales bacterium]
MYKDRYISLTKKLETVLNQAIEDKYIPGANLLVLKEGQEIAYCQAGYTDVEGRIPVRRDSIYRMYSLSKPITGAAVMILMERGLIDLADPVSKYLPGFVNQKVATDAGPIPVKRDMMIKDLLSMTSGLPYPDPSHPAGREADEVFRNIIDNLHSASAMTTLQIANSLGKCSLHFQPGEHWMYGTSADILGAIVEVVSGMKYSEFLKKEIFDPLGMKDTAFYVPSDKQDRFAKLYENVNDTFIEKPTNNLGIEYTMKNPPAFESGGAGLASTIEDYAKFATMLLNHGELDGVKILSPKTVEFFTSGELLPGQQEDMRNRETLLAGYTYSNLMRVMKKPGLAFLNGAIGEYGWDGWLGTYFCNFPNEKISFLFMMQKKDSGTDTLTRKLRNIVMAELF